MPEDYQICPYTGLRSFTEEESLYFKGREDDIDQATTQLQRNKFLMLTGASGDGKSSLVYAGIIPNARAGFLKSTYSNWCIADFRPERIPFQNLCRSLGRQLDITNTNTVEVELNHGFSAVVDLYKNSKRFVDVNSVAWKMADDKEKARMKREAANLIILVDQFEEFFTNPENYQLGVPSRDANLVLNLLLETSRIALEEDLPIYVIFTMRSDYIGQCAAFRGLPEYLGFSQFFVPRLNRTQLQQVIEEPAVLSGNRITRRLTERLVHDLTEGVDQLPILQHALNQIWGAASLGKEEMDLIHYAMVGGMSVNELPDEQVAGFNEWFSSLSPEIRACYHAPNLQNVLDTHTNKLLEQSAGYYTAKTGKSIPEESAKKIIRNAFTCLTKIDQSRAVRNRMTLQEITNILGDKSIDTNTVGAVLNIFREPGNTFIHPFIAEENPDSRDLRSGQVLDITHESLIRNWEYLGNWAKEEFDSHSVSLDFERQLQRWVDSNKSNAFLLSIGQLTYFENWYKAAKPNTWWIARYLPEETSKEIKLEKSEEILSHAREFLKRSAGKHRVTRTIMRYGPKRIAAVIGILALLVLSSFVVRNYFQRQNSAVLKSIHTQSLVLAANPKINLLNKSLLLNEELRLGGTTIEEISNSIKDSLEKIKVINGMASVLIILGKGEPKTLVFKELSVIDSLFEAVPIPINNIKQLSAGLKAENDFRANLELSYYFDADPRVQELKKRNAKRSARWTMTIAESQPLGFNDIKEFSIALENAVNYHAFNDQELNKLLRILSPFENGLNTTWLKSNFEKDKFLKRSGFEYGFKFNGLYQDLAYLYSAMGNSEKALQCIDTLLANSQNNFQGDYATLRENASHIAAVYYANGKTDQLDAFVNGYCSRKKISSEEFYARLLGWTLPSDDLPGSTGITGPNHMNLILRFSSRAQLGFFYSKYRESVELTTKDPEQKNFLLAVSYKNEGILKSISKALPEKNELTTQEFFNKSLTYYKTVSQKFLDQPVQTPLNSGADQILLPRKFIFIYPDLRSNLHPDEPRGGAFYYFGDAFLKFILANSLFDTFYPGQADIKYFSMWFNDYCQFRQLAFYFPLNTVSPDVFTNLDKEFERRNVSNEINLNWWHLDMADEEIKSGNQEQMLDHYSKVKLNNIISVMQSKDFGSLSQTFLLLGKAMVGYAKANKHNEVFKIAGIFKNPINRSSLYGFAATQLLEDKFKGNIINQLLDSAKAELPRVENFTGFQPNRQVLVYALAMQDPSENSREAQDLIKNLFAKFFYLEQITRAFAFSGELYEAQKNIPELISADDQANFLRMILLGYFEGNKPVADEWKKYTVNCRFNFNQPIYVDDTK